MEKTFLLMATVIMTLSSCSFNVSSVGPDIIEASSNIVKKEYKLDSFNEVTSHIVADIKLVQDEKKDGVVILSAPDNYIELFNFTSKDGELDISYTRNNINIMAKDVKITIYTTDLLKIKNTGAASISLESLDTDNLDVINSGVGSFRLNNVLADMINVKCSGVGDISIDGKTINAELSCSGVGSIHAKELKSDHVKASVSGVGGITCFASESIEGKVSGVGSLKYAGHPQKTNLNKPSMVGSITEI